MKVGCFLDTNVLLCAAPGRDDEPEKWTVSRNLLAAWNFGVSTQVLGELFVNAQRKSKRPLAVAESMAWVAELEHRPGADIDRQMVRSAIGISRSLQISYWDAAILAAAERRGSPVVYSEDLNHGQLYGSVQVVNPFRAN